MRPRGFLRHDISLISFLLISVILALSACEGTAKQDPETSASTDERVAGPYTVHTLSEGVYRIEDANDDNPAGIITDEDGKTVRMNNCSDMYLLVGGYRALLIDLSNDIKWDDTATESLRSIVYERAGKRALTITVSHNHGDHLGMLPAFADDANADFWVPGPEFVDRKIFPAARTTYFSENASLDLGGGFVVDTMELPGHTAHSTAFFLKDRNLLFTGDAVGSGSGVWLFSYDSFLSYRDSIERLIAYLEDPGRSFSLRELEIHGGHSWQQGKVPALTAQYFYDMRTLMERIGQGAAEAEAVSLPLSFLDTNFKYGLATITWNKAASLRYAESLRAK